MCSLNAGGTSATAQAAAALTGPFTCGTGRLPPAPALWVRPSHATLPALQFLGYALLTLLLNPRAMPLPAPSARPDEKVDSNLTLFRKLGQPPFGEFLQSFVFVPGRFPEVCRFTERHGFAAPGPVLKRLPAPHSISVAGLSCKAPVHWPAMASAMSSWIGVTEPAR